MILSWIELSQINNQAYQIYHESYQETLTFNFHFHNHFQIRSKMLDIKDAKAQSSLVNLANGGDETKSIKGNAFDICILVFIIVLFRPFK